MLDQELPKSIILTGVITSSLSLLGSILVLTTFLVSRRARENIFFLWVFNLSIADCLLSIGSLFNWDKADEFECNLFSVATGCGLIGSFMFIAYIALFLYKSTQRDLEESFIETKKWQIIGSTYFLMAILSIGPLFTKSYGKGAEFCWLKTDLSASSLTWTIIEYYIPIITSVPLISVLYYKTYRNAADERFQAKSIRIFLYIPLLYIFANLFAVTDRVLAYTDNSSDLVKILHIISRQLQGFYHCIIYGYGYVRNSLLNESLLSQGSKKQLLGGSKQDENEDSVLSFDMSQ